MFGNYAEFAFTFYFLPSNCTLVLDIYGLNFACTWYVLSQPSFYLWFPFLLSNFLQMDSPCIWIWVPASILLLFANTLILRWPFWSRWGSTGDYSPIWQVKIQISQLCFSFWIRRYSTALFNQWVYHGSILRTQMTSGHKCKEL